jgi:hypothetical protein
MSKLLLNVTPVGWNRIVGKTNTGPPLSPGSCHDSCQSRDNAVGEPSESLDSRNDLEAGIAKARNLPDQFCNFLGFTRLIAESRILELCPRP